MLQKTFSKLILIPTVCLLCSCEFIRAYTAQEIFGTNTNKAQQNENISYESNVPLLKQPSSIVVCRSHQCAPSKLSMSKEYIYNSLLHLFDNNNYQKLLICQADAQTHTCIENYITLPVKVGIVPTNAYIDHVKITDVIMGRSSNSLNLILNYNLTYGGQVADCTPSQSLLFARKINHVIIEDSGYNCKMTTIGTTNVKTVFAIDYIDLDYGYIGGYYSVGLSGPAYGGGNGYMLLRMPKNAYPLAPALKAPRNYTSGQIDSPTGPDLSNGILQERAPSHTNGVQVFPIEKK